MSHQQKPILVAFQNIKRTFLGRPFRHCIPTNVTNNYPQAWSLMTRDQQTSLGRTARQDGGNSLSKRLLGDLIKGRQVYDASYHQADCNFRLLIGQYTSQILFFDPSLYFQGPSNIFKK